MHNQLKSINLLEDKIKKMNSNVNYIIEKFTEVDKSCASRIKTSGYDYRKKIGLLTMGERIGDNPVGNTIDGIESWYDRNKNTIEKVSIITLEVVGTVLSFVFFPEVSGVTWGARAIGWTWRALTVVQAGISADTVQSNANELYDRNVKKKSSVEIQKGIDNGDWHYGFFRGASGDTGYFYSHTVKGESVKDAIYEKQCWMTGYDRTSSVICTANTFHSFYNAGKDVLLIPKDSEKVAKAYEAMQELDDKSYITNANLLKTQNKIDRINTAQQNVDYIEGIKGKVSKADLGQYKKDFNYYKNSRYLENNNGSLPRLNGDAQNYNSELADLGLQKQTILKDPEFIKAKNGLDSSKTDLNLDKYLIPSSLYLYDKENIKDGFHSEYFPSELKAMGLGDGK